MTAAGADPEARNARAARRPRRGFSVRQRLFVALVVVNILVLGTVQLSSFELQNSWLERNGRTFEQQVYEEVFRYAYSDVVDDPDAAADRIVRNVLRPELRDRLRVYFKDAFVTNSAESPALVDLNPLGAAERDPATFPFAEIRAGIGTAMRDRELVRAGDGFCVALVSAGRVVGGAWVEPRLPPQPPLPFSVVAVPVVVGTLLIGALTYWLVGRMVVRPLRRVGGTARQFGAGRYDVRLAPVGAPEVDVFLDAFNAMAGRIEGHHAELAAEVERATEEARRRERALVQSSRLASMGTLAAGIAHEVNNPIGGMQNAIRRIGKNPALDDRERVYVELIEEGLERVARTARRVLDFSPRETDARPFRVATAVEGARALVEHRLTRSRIELETDLADDLPEVVGDRHEFEQVLLNLFLNSADVLEGRDPPRTIRVVGRRDPAGGLDLLVEDDGPGIARDQLDRVCDPFFTAKGRPDATGLGLFISFSIIRNLGGAMDIDSDVGEGFHVRIRIPADAEPRGPDGPG